MDVQLLKSWFIVMISEVKAVPTDFTCTQMQQTWHKSHPQTEAEPFS